MIYTFEVLCDGCPQHRPYTVTTVCGDEKQARALLDEYLKTHYGPRFRAGRCIAESVGI